MALTSALFAEQVARDRLDQDFRRDSLIFRIFGQSPVALDLLRQCLAGGPAGGFAKKLLISRLNQTTLNPTDGYTAASYPGSEDVDLSSAYAQLTDDYSTLNVNKHFIGTFRVPEIYKMTHAAGALLSDAKFKADIQEIIDNIEEGFCNDMMGLGRPESVNAGVATRFNLDTSSQANLMSDIGILHGDMAAQNVPATERKYMVVNPVVVGKIMQWPGLISHDIMDAGNSDFGEGTLLKVGGFTILPTNSMGAAGGFCIAESRAAIVVPTGFRIKTLEDINTISEYGRVWCEAGWAALGKVVTAADGDAWSTAHEGISVFNVT